MFVSRLLSAIATTVAALGVVTALPAPALAQDVIKVGAPLPLTGPLSPEGLKQKRGYDLWAEAANAKGIKAGGKTYKVEIVYADYASNTPRAVQTAERMITEDKVQFLFAPFGSGATKAASAISEKYRLPMLAPSASSQEIFDQHFKYIFSTLTGNETVSAPIAKLVAAKNKNIKRVAVLARNDLFPLAVAQEFEKAVKAEGMEVVVSERYAIGAMDHSAAITKMRAANPDWVYASGYINDLMLIRRQMNDLGLKAPVITEIAGPAYGEFARTMGPLAENITSMSWWHPAVRYKGPDVFGSTEAFNAAFAKKYNGAEADYIEAGSAACGAILQMAIEKAGTVDPVKVRDAISATDAETFYGRVRFNADGQINSLQPPVFQLVGGKPVILWPDAIKSGEIRFMPK
ncbi:MAG: amino acid ABC transporter substrate-binding protein [Xanthobacteraceae bacterium]|nr:amino acid ABC transporter substrate-binding protein [Xanthobacteraceae bacterium]